MLSIGWYGHGIDVVESLRLLIKIERGDRLAVDRVSKEKRDW